MGQRELLFIILGLILLSVAVLVGLNLFSVSKANSNRDQVIMDLNNFAADAQIHFKKISNMGGGQGSYNGWSLSNDLKTKGNENGTYSAKVKSQKVTITGNGKELGENGRTNIKIQAVVTPDDITIKTQN